MEERAAVERRAQQLGSWLDSLPLNRRHFLVFAVAFAGIVFDALDLQLMSYAAPAVMKEWALTPQVLGTVISAGMFGMLIGTYVFGVISDHIGRRPGFQLTVAIFAFFSGLCALARNAVQLMTMRAFVGVGAGGFIPIDSTLVAEFMPARRRGLLMALGAASFPLGGFLAAWVAGIIMPSLGWRALFLVGVVPAIMVLVFRRFIPETPRFLLAKGRIAEAEASARWIGMDTPLPEGAPVTVTMGKARPVARRFSVAELFSRTYGRRTLLAWSIWFFWSFPYYGLLLWLPTLLTRYLNIPQATAVAYMMGFNIAGIVGRVLVMTIVDRVGRKPIIILSGVCMAALVLLLGAQREVVGLMIFGYLYVMLGDGCYSAITPYVPELYPTHARATGVGWATGAGRIAATIAPAVVGFLVASSLYSVFIMFAVSFVIGSTVVAVIGIETGGQSLEVTSMEQSREPQPAPASGNPA